MDTNINKTEEEIELINSWNQNHKPGEEVIIQGDDGQLKKTHTAGKAFIGRGGKAKIVLKDPRGHFSLHKIIDRISDKKDDKIDETKIPFWIRHTKTDKLKARLGRSRQRTKAFIEAELKLREIIENETVSKDKPKQKIVRPQSHHPQAKKEIQNMKGNFYKLKDHLLNDLKTKEKVELSKISINLLFNNIHSPWGIIKPMEQFKIFLSKNNMKVVDESDTIIVISKI